MAFFKSKQIGGQVFDLSHLEPFDFTLIADNRPITVHVEFGCHCFTEKLSEHHTPDLRYTHNGETRAFNAERHRLSFKLPDLIQTVGSKTVYHTKKGSYFILRDESIEGKKVPYLVFFSAFKSTNKTVHVQLLVRSAYLKPEMAERAAPVRFSTLMQFVRDGRTPPQGPTIQMKRTQK